MENTTKEGNEFEPGINEPQEEVPIVDDEQLRALPGNEEEEKEEILMPFTTAAKITKPKVSTRRLDHSSLMVNILHERDYVYDVLFFLLHLICWPKLMLLTLQ